MASPAPCDPTMWWLRGRWTSPCCPERAWPGGPGGLPPRNITSGVVPSSCDPREEGEPSPLQGVHVALGWRWVLTHGMAQPPSGDHSTAAHLGSPPEGSEKGRRRTLISQSASVLHKALGAPTGCWGRGLGAKVPLQSHLCNKVLQEAQSRSRGSSGGRRPGGAGSALGDTQDGVGQASRCPAGGSAAGPLPPALGVGAEGASGTPGPACRGAGPGGDAPSRAGLRPASSSFLGGAPRAMRAAGPSRQTPSAPPAAGARISPAVGGPGRPPGPWAAALAACGALRTPRCLVGRPGLGETPGASTGLRAPAAGGLTFRP